MPNKQYIKGRSKEYSVVKQYKNKGYQISQRTAGSHSPIDVIAIDWDLRLIKLIQCKPDTISKSKTLKLYDKYSRLKGLFHVEFIIL